MDVLVYLTVSILHCFRSPRAAQNAKPNPKSLSTTSTYRHAPISTAKTEKPKRKRENLAIRVGGEKRQTDAGGGVVARGGGARRKREQLTGSVCRSRSRGSVVFAGVSNDGGAARPAQAAAPPHAFARSPPRACAPRRTFIAPPGLRSRCAPR